ncbi:hypothetical protein [Paenibacillus apii]
MNIRNGILEEASRIVLAQANQMSEAVLSLLK